MRIEKKYASILFIFFMAISIALTITAYILANTILINKYTELYENESKYILTVTENDLDQLNKTFNVLQQNSSIINIMNDGDNPPSQYTRVKSMDNINTTLSSFKTFNAFKYLNAVTFKTNNGTSYWYGIGNNFFEENKIEEALKTLPPGSRDLIYIDTSESIFVEAPTPYGMQFAKNYYNIEGKNVGSIFFELDTTYLNQILGNYKTTVNSDVYLVDNNNTILYTNTDFTIASTLPESILQTNSKNDIVVNETLSHYNWKLIIKSSKEKITQDNHLILEITLLAALLSVILELLFTSYIMKKLFTPIHFLSIGLKELTGGNFDKKISYYKNDEIGRACKDFNVLSTTLQKTIDLELEYQMKVKESEYKALQSQINPHFLYNSLNSLKWMANLQHVPHISAMVDSLWKLFKSASKQQGMQITLEEELEIVDSYSCIQEVRYKRKFILLTEISDNTKSFIIPKFILQPFVENSIFHGIAPKDDDGTITIKASLCKENQEDMLKLIVKDDGVGMDEDTLQNLTKPSQREDSGRGMNNIAIYNIVDRLKLLYSRDDLLNITSKVGFGTTVTILIPQKSEAQNNLGERMVKRLKDGKEDNLK